MKANATFYTFRRSGKFYTDGRGFCPESAFDPMLDNATRRGPVLAANDGKIPGMSSAAEDMNVVVTLDKDVSFGWPLMLHAREE